MDSMLEKEIEKNILDALNKSGLGYFWKNPSIGVYDVKKRTFRAPKGKHQIRGVSDIIGITRGGKAVFIEVKSAKGRLSSHQADFLETAEYWGALCGVARSVEDAFKLLKNPD